MGLFSKKDKELEWLLSQIKVDLSNNYKESALENLQKFEEIFSKKVAEGKLKNSEDYRIQMETLKRDIASFKRTY